ncbi:MAG: hypothetical protein ACQET5_13485 [Halobacteriota archaeon]|uniref:hypothetical protein n=1 Tax=Natronomonas sp. TaxID=2184060 RepID=UPI0039768077
MKHEPTRYSRLLVFVGLLPLLLADLFVGLPDGAFVGGGAVVMAAAAIIHFYGGEPLAGAGWLVFGAALGLVSLVDPTANALYIVAFALLLLGGLALLVSQRTVDRGAERE